MGSVEPLQLTAVINQDATAKLVKMREDLIQLTKSSTAWKIEYRL